MEERASTAGWTLTIRPRSEGLDLRLGELWRYRDLVGLFVRRDFVAKYKQTVLGPLWHLLRPLLTTVVFTIVFGNIAGISTEGRPGFLFYMAGTVVWGYFASCVATTSRTLIANADLFGKVYFPRLTLPVSVLLSNLVTFGLQLLFFLGFIGFFLWRGADVDPNRWVLLTPALLLLLAMIGLGVGLLVSALTATYRDFAQLVPFGLSLLMYASPVIYPTSAVPERYRAVVLANPVAPVIESFRYAFLGSGTVSPSHLVYSGAFALCVLFAGVVVFHRVERTFVDTV